MRCVNSRRQPGRFLGENLDSVRWFWMMSRLTTDRKGVSVNAWLKCWSTGWGETIRNMKLNHQHGVTLPMPWRKPVILHWQMTFENVINESRTFLTMLVSPTPSCSSMYILDGMVHVCIFVINAANCRLLHLQWMATLLCVTFIV